MPAAQDPPASPRVVVVGSLIMDLVVRVPRPPLVGESLFGHDFQLFPGGKGGNQAVAAARLGASVTMIGRVGEDDFGGLIVASLKAERVDCRGVIRDREHGTGVAIPMVYDDGSNSIVTLPRANLALSASDVDAMADIIAGADALFVQCEAGAEATRQAIGLARASGVPAFLNAAPAGLHDARTIEAADHLIVNEVEAAALAPAANGDHLAEARALLGERPGSVVVTLGQQGALLATHTGAHAVEAFPVAAVDSVGAGDAFCAAYAVAILSGMPLADAARFASAAGAIAVTRAGARSALPSRAEVERLLADSQALTIRVDDAPRHRDT